MIGPELGVRMRDGMVVVTTKVALAMSAVIPFTVTMYGPGVAAALTVKLLPTN